MLAPQYGQNKAVFAHVDVQALVYRGYDTAGISISTYSAVNSQSSSSSLASNSENEG